MTNMTGHSPGSLSDANGSMQEAVEALYRERERQVGPQMDLGVTPLGIGEAEEHRGDDHPRRRAPRRRAGGAAASSASTPSRNVRRASAAIAR